MNQTRCLLVKLTGCGEHLVVWTRIYDKFQLQAPFDSSSRVHAVKVNPPLVKFHIHLPSKNWWKCDVIVEWEATISSSGFKTVFEEDQWQGWRADLEAFALQQRFFYRFKTPKGAVNTQTGRGPDARRLDWATSQFTPAGFYRLKKLSLSLSLPQRRCRDPCGDDDVM